MSGNIILEASNNIFLDNTTLNFTLASSITLIADADNDGIGNANMANTSTINTGGNKLQTLQNGFASVTIGRTDGTGNITISDPNLH